MSGPTPVTSKPTSWCWVRQTHHSADNPVIASTSDSADQPFGRNTTDNSDRLGSARRRYAMETAELRDVGVVEDVLVAKGP